jgi:hypothetical protein
MLYGQATNAVQATDNEHRIVRQSNVLTIVQQSYMYSQRSAHKTPLGCALDCIKLVYESCSHTMTCSASGKGPWRIKCTRRRSFGVRMLGSGELPFCCLPKNTPASDRLDPIHSRYSGVSSVRPPRWSYRSMTQGRRSDAELRQGTTLVGPPG